MNFCPSKQNLVGNEYLREKIKQLEFSCDAFELPTMRFIQAGCLPCACDPLHKRILGAPQVEVGPISSVEDVTTAVITLIA